MADILIEVPGPPVPKARARTVISKRTGKVMTFTPPRTASYEKLVRDCAWLAVRRARWGMRVSAVAVDIEVRRQSGAFDLDNVIKSLLDGLNGVVWKDDRQVYRICAVMRDGVSPGVRIVVRDMEGD